jgi:hypothetical protein
MADARLVWGDPEGGKAARARIIGLAVIYNQRVASTRIAQAQDARNRADFRLRANRSTCRALRFEVHP